MPFGPVEWHFPLEDNRKSQSDDDKISHGSCVASKAAGFVNGVSKNSRIVMMKASLKLADDNWAFSAALDDIILKGRQGRAVVVYPRTSKHTFSRIAVPPELPDNWFSIKNLMNELFENDTPVVTGAGNNASRSLSPDTVPAVWDRASRQFPLIAVGSMDTIGIRTSWTQNMHGSAVWAPGIVQCAGGPSSADNVIAKGTSFSAAMVCRKSCV